jgi:hypothetical protein
MDSVIFSIFALSSGLDIKSVTDKKLLERSISLGSNEELKIKILVFDNLTFSASIFSKNSNPDISGILISKKIISGLI